MRKYSSKKSGVKPVFNTSAKGTPDPINAALMNTQASSVSPSTPSYYGNGVSQKDAPTVADQYANGTLANSAKPKK